MTSSPGSACYPLTIYYDAACPLCRAEMTNLMLRNHAGLLRFEDASAPGFASPLPGVPLAGLMALIHARRADGAVVRGVEVFRLAYTAVGLPGVARALRLPLLRTLAERTYPLLARNRHRIPRVLVLWLFETAARRAAENSARCTPGGACRLPR